MKKWILLAIVCLLGMVMVAAVALAQDGNNPNPIVQEPGYSDEQIAEPAQDDSDSYEEVDGEQLTLASAPETAVGTGFSYQGRIEDGGNPVNGNCDFQFTLWDTGSGGTQVGNVDAQANVAVSNGLFSVIVNSSSQFGEDAFKGDARWLQVAVRCPAGAGSYATLSPREVVTAVPYARYALEANTLSPGALIRGAGNQDLFKVLATSGQRAIVGQTNVNGGEAVHAAARSGGVNYAVYAFTDSSQGYGGYFRNKSNGTALYASSTPSNANGSIWGKDLVLGGPVGTIHGSSIINVANRDFTIHLDENGDDANSYFRVYRGNDNHVLFQVTEDGISQAKVLRITGGSDLSESFDVNVTATTKEPEPGMIVSIDAQNPGKLIVSETAYDRTVAGIISGAGDVDTGMLMGHDGTLADGEYPVALTGRVYVWADASYGAIQPGDLLTTSNTPGHAMKVTDYGRGQGAILGKAMTELDSGQGLILVLVTLQ